jgi:hypothetical protein
LLGGVEIRDVEVAAITSEVTIYREEATPEKKYNNNQDMAKCNAQTSMMICQISKMILKLFRRHGEMLDEVGNTLA